MGTVTGASPTSVYRYFDAAGDVLYVGITARGHTRATEHARSKNWWPLVASSTVAHFDTREAARREEARLISYLRPPYNVQGRPAGPPRVTRIPIALARTLNGRLSRPTSLHEVDPERFAEGIGEFAPVARELLATSIRRGDSVPDLRDRIKRMAA